MAETMGTTITFSGGYGNVNGGLNRNDINWIDRSALIAAKIVAMDVTWFVAMDLYDANTAYQPLIQAMPTTWGMVLGKGNIHMLYRKDLYKVVSATGTRLEDDKWLIKWQLQDLVSGVRFWVMGAQLSEDTIESEKSKLRVTQTRAIISGINSIYNGILCIDRYSSTPDPGYPLAIFTSAGWQGLRERAVIPVIDGDA